MRNLISLFISAVMIFGFTAALRAEPAVTASAPADAKSEWEIEKITLHRDDGTGEPGEETAFFYPEDHAHHVIARFKSLRFGLIQPTIRFISVNTAAGRDTLIVESKSDTALVGNEFKGALTLKKDFPVGYYRFELDINGKPATAGNYCVMEKPENFRIYEYSLHLPDKDGDLGDEVKSFKTANRHLYLSVRTSGIKPGTLLKWIWRGLDTEKGSGEVTTAEGRITDVGIFNLRPDLTLEKNLPAGSYSLEMFLDGKEVGSFPFSIAN